MKLALVLAEIDPDTVVGSENVPELTVPAARLSTALAKAGWDVTVYLPSCDPRHHDDEVISAQGYRVIRLPGGSPREAISKNIGEFTEHLQQAWQRDRPEVVHAQSWLSGMAAQSAARSQRIPMVQSFDTGAGWHATGPQATNEHKLMSVLARRASWVAANNTEELFELLRTGCARSRISVIPCGVDSEVFTPPGPTAQRGACQYRIVSIWTATGQVDLETAVQSLTVLPDTEFVLAVDPASAVVADVRARLERLAGTAGVADRVAVEEVRNSGDLTALLRSADVCACPAVTEPTGVGALMAMGCGVPVLGTTVGALVDIVVDEVTGRMVPAGDVMRFSEAARRMLHEPFAGRGMGAAGRDRAKSRYSWDRVAADAMRAYNGAVNAAGVVSA